MPPPHGDGRSSGPLPIEGRQVPPPGRQSNEPYPIGVSQEILREIRRCRDENTRMSGDIARINTVLRRLEENYSKLRDEFKEYTIAVFSIESSEYKVILLYNFVYFAMTFSLL